VWLGILAYREREHRKAMRQLETWYLQQLAIIKHQGDFYEQVLGDPTKNN